VLALIYLAVAVYLGDCLCRRFYRFASFPHRCATALIVGLLVASWFTYLVALAFAKASLPLFWANLFFFVAAMAFFSWPKRKNKIIKTAKAQTQEPTADNLFISRPVGSDALDWLLIVAYFAFAYWLMFATLSSSGGKLLIANNEYSDFGPNTAIMQSFAVGHNFPTEYPHFSGERILYHFLFYFQAGNLEFLGLDPAWSLNFLSILSMLAMLVLVMTLGEMLFNSRAVGRLGAVLFFFFGSLSYIPFFYKQGSWRAALHTILQQRDFLPSIFPYRGELWGVWSQVTFANQRHLCSSIAVLLMVLIFLVAQYRALAARQALSSASVQETNPEPGAPEATPERIWPGFVFAGALLGLLPMWNSAVFIAAAAVLGLLFILCPLRRQMLAMAIAAGVLAFPQIIYLSTGSERVPMPHLIHWGYTLDQPTALNVAKYLGFTFGFKWLLIAVALIFAAGLPRRMFVATSGLIVIAFLFQFTVEVLANQKFLHIWIIIANLFVAYALWRLWRFSLGGSTIPGKIAALVLCAAIVPGGIIDLFPLHNGYWNAVTYRNDPLIEWLMKQTKPRDIFLTDRFVNHPILMAGRRVFYGWPYYGWSAGYDATMRDRVYQDLFESKDSAKVFRLLKENGIAYVAFDNAVRHGSFIKRPNEQIYAKCFTKVFEDNNYNGLAIYQIPENPPAQFASLPEISVSMFEGGHGNGKGQFDAPRGMAADSNGNIFVADTNNGRIEKFSSSGAFITSIGTKGTGYGQFGEPNGIAIDRSGNIYVAEASNHRVQKLTAAGDFIVEWKGPDPGFYGPRRIAIAPDDSIYVVDQGRARIVKLNPDGQVLATWGSKGNGDGQFDDHTSVAVDPKSNNVYVADPRNQRIQVFDGNGHFLRKWSVPEWQHLYGFEDLAIDPKAGKLYASSANMDAVLIFDLNGSEIGSLRPTPPDKLEGPSALSLANGKLYVLCMFGNRVSEIDLPSP
jgi:DNA-binding beta-propeller fold protein YncE